MSDIFFPDLNAALPEPDAGTVPQTNVVSSAFQGILSGATAIADAFTDLQLVRSEAKAAANNLRSLGREAEANYVEQLGSSAFANPFTPDQNAKLREEISTLFQNTTSSLRQQNAQLALQSAQDREALERLRLSGTQRLDQIQAGGEQSRLTQESGFGFDEKMETQRQSGRLELERERTGDVIDTTLFGNDVRIPADRAFSESAATERARISAGARTTSGRPGGVTATQMEAIGNAAGGNLQDTDDFQKAYGVLRPYFTSEQIQRDKELQDEGESAVVEYDNASRASKGRQTNETIEAERKIQRILNERIDILQGLAQGILSSVQNVPTGPGVSLGPAPRPPSSAQTPLNLPQGPGVIDTSLIDAAFAE